MRVALLSMLDSAGELGEGHKAFIPFAGKTIARRQIELALALGCERVVCLADNLGPGLIALQHEVESAGAKFHVISVPRALCGLVYATDELIMLADGVLPLADEARDILAKGNAIVVVSAETGIPAGFERIDLNHAWAGALVMPGKLVERLNELPQDCDGVSSLLRIALQGRVPERVLADTALAEGRWAMLSTTGDAASLEPAWFRRHAASADPFTPGRWLAFGLAARFGVGWLNRGIRPGYLLTCAVLLLCLALVGGWMGMIAGGFAALGLSWFLADASQSLDHGERAGGEGKPFFAKAIQAFALMADLAVIALLAMAMDGMFASLFALLFMPLTLMGLVWLVPYLSHKRWAGLLGDRVVLALILALGATADILPELTQCLILILVGCAIVLSRAERRLTQI